MLGYLSLDIICSSKLTVFFELRSRKTARFSEQIMSADKYPSIFSRQMKAIVYKRLKIKLEGFINLAHNLCQTGVILPKLKTSQLLFCVPQSNWYLKVENFVRRPLFGVWRKSISRIITRFNLNSDNFHSFADIIITESKPWGSWFGNISIDSSTICGAGINTIRQQRFSVLELYTLIRLKFFSLLQLCIS